jgi:hypothetical protein
MAMASGTASTGQGYIQGGPGRPGLFGPLQGRFQSAIEIGFNLIGQPPHFGAFFLRHFTHTAKQSGYTALGAQVLDTGRFHFGRVGQFIEGFGSFLMEGL